MRLQLRQTFHVATPTYWLGIGAGDVAGGGLDCNSRGSCAANIQQDLLPPLVLGAEPYSAWVGGFDIIYACQDFENDRDGKGLHSVPAKVRVSHGALRIAAVSHLR